MGVHPDHLTAGRRESTGNFLPGELPRRTPTGNPPPVNSVPRERIHGSPPRRMSPSTYVLASVPTTRTARSLSHVRREHAPPVRDLAVGGASMREIVRGYWCECRTEDLAGAVHAALLASMDAYSAAQADRWIAVALRTITPAARPRRGGRGLGLAVRRPHRDETGPAALGTVFGVGRQQDHPAHLDRPPCPLPAPRAPGGHAAFPTARTGSPRHRPFPPPVRDLPYKDL